MADNVKTVIFEKKGSAGWITFSRPERMNALAPESLREMWQILSQLEADPEIRAAVFTGQGDKAFCAGMEMAGMENSPPLTARRRSRQLQMLTNRIAEYSLPTIAAVNGVAMGAGLEICLACDFVLASTAARFGFPEVRLGMIPCGGGTQRLARLIGLRKARDMILAGKIIDAEQARDWGLANDAVQPAMLSVEVEKIMEKLVQGGRIAMFQAKRCLNHALDMDINRGLEYETECFTTCFASGEPAQGLKRYSGDTQQDAQKPEVLEEEAKVEQREQPETKERVEEEEERSIEEREEEEEEEEEDIFE
jgi:enoyl-CoA hydratase